MSTATSRLREQNRKLTGAIIHEVTYKLVATNGLAATSIDDIAREANVSRRTFFNYYASKENALYGLMHPTLPQEAQSAFMTSTEPTLMRCLLLILSMYRTSIADGSTPERRRKLHQDYPTTHTKFEIYMAEIEKLVEPLVTQIYNGNKTSTTLILYTAGAVLKYCRKIDPPMNKKTLKTAIATLHTITQEELHEQEKKS